MLVKVKLKDSVNDVVKAVSGVDALLSHNYSTIKVDEETLNKIKEHSEIDYEAVSDSKVVMTIDNAIDMLDAATSAMSHYDKLAYINAEISSNNIPDECILLVRDYLFNLQMVEGSLASMMLKLESQITVEEDEVDTQPTKE